MKRFIIETLGLEDVQPEHIPDDEPLFGGKLNLDSIDAFELGIALRKKYKLKLDGDDPGTRNHFRSVRSLVDLVASQS
jgi:acyl carrier protein